MLSFKAKYFLSSVAETSGEVFIIGRMVMHKKERLGHPEHILVKRLIFRAVRGIIAGNF